MMTETTTRTWDDMRGGYIDSRDVIERLNELESAASEGPSDLGCAYCGEGSMPDSEFESLCSDHADELRILRSFAEQGEGFSDWQYGETFIPDSDFTDHARELAEDIGAIHKDGEWPTLHIDWEAAADALRMDYMSIEVDGETYWGRA